MRGAPEAGVLESGVVDAGMLGSLEVEVRLGSWASSGVATDDLVPAAGAVVAFDAPDGTRTEARTDDLGRVRFDGFEWSDGEAAVTAFSEQGHRRVVSHTGLTAADALAGPVVVELFARPESETVPTVSVTGRLTSMRDVDHMHSVTVDHPAVSLEQSAGPSFALEVPSGRPFTLVALEFEYRGHDRPGHVRAFEQVFYGWTRAEFEGFEADGTIEVDMSDRLPVTTVRHTIEYPPSLRDRAIEPYATVAARGNTLFVGAPTRLRATSSSVAMDLEYAELGPDEEYGVRYVFSGTDLFAEVYFRGDPADPPPPLLVPPAFRSPPRRSGLLEWEYAPGEPVDDLLSGIKVINSQGYAIVHDVFSRSTSSRIPELPSGLTAEVVYGASPLVMVVGCRDLARDLPFEYSCSYGALVPLLE